MIQQQNLDGSGFALFSDDMKMRFRLGRAIDPMDGLIFKAAKTWNEDHSEVGGRLWLRGMYGLSIYRVVFLLLNPSVANAFKPDRTVARCFEFGRRWGARIVEVVNLFAFISPYPSDLLKLERGQRGDDAFANAAIIEACAGANRVIAGWGTDGAIDGRADEVRKLLHERRIQVEALDFTKEGFPKHPLARGKHFVPYDTMPQAWPYIEAA